MPYIYYLVSDIEGGRSLHGIFFIFDYSDKKGSECYKCLYSIVNNNLASRLIATILYNQLNNCYFNKYIFAALLTRHCSAGINSILNSFNFVTITVSFQKKPIMIFPKSFLFAVICGCAFGAQDECIQTVEQLKESFDMYENNVNELVNSFTPTNKPEPDIVFVNYCVRENPTDTEDPNCTMTFHFEWLDTVIPLAVDYAVFTALTFNFAKLNSATVNLKINGSFCENLTRNFDEVHLLGSLTSNVSIYIQHVCIII